MSPFKQIVERHSTQAHPRSKMLRYSQFRSQYCLGLAREVQMEENAPKGHTTWTSVFEIGRLEDHPKVNLLLRN